MGIAVADAFCGRSNGCLRSSSARFDMCAGSLTRRGEQFGQTHEVVGSHRDRKLPIDFKQSAMQRF
jgi:hypothetical protein